MEASGTMLTDEEKLEFVQNRILHAVERSHRDSLRDEMGRRTLDEVFDRPTLLTIWKLVHRNVMKTLDFPISTGKEANVFHATDPKGSELAVKIFRVDNATFFAFKEYIQGDPRFEAKGNRRELVHAWVRKEYKNLLRFHDGGLRVPAPIEALNNVLCMEFLGEEGTPAPLLKDVEMEDPSEPYAELVEWIRVAWRDLGMVHGDLSEFNVMVHANMIWVIDVGQAVMNRHPMAREFLLRDLTNVNRFFGKHGVDVTPAERLFAEVVAKAPEPAADGEAVS